MASSSTSNIKNVAVFCGSLPGKGAAFTKAAEHLGEVLAKEKLHLVYGGGNQGLMGIVSKAVHAGGSQVLGIVPAPLKPLVGMTRGEELVVPGMMERLTQMLSRSDAFIALPGGLGTLEETIHVATWNQLNIHPKPIGLLNIDHFYDGFLSFLDRAVELEFMSLASRQILISADTAEELIEKLRAYKHDPHPEARKLDWSAGGSKKRHLDLSLGL